MPVRLISVVNDAYQPVTLAEARLQLRVEFEDEDSLIESLILVATQAASDRLQRALVPSRYRLTQDAFTDVIELLMPPVASVESLTYFDEAGTLQTLAPSAWLLDAASEPARLVPAVGSEWPATQCRPSAVTVNYTAGYPVGAIPATINQWILLAVADLYNNRERSSDKPKVPQNFADSLLDTYRIWGL
jgi:uncharacterized phiE125 gp8 family phage protein